MSASETIAPATFHCTFSKVAQKTAARKKNGTRGSLVSSGRQSSSASSSTRASRESLLPLLGGQVSAVLQLPGPPAACRARISASRIAFTSSGATTMPARLADRARRRRRPAGTDGQDRPLGGEVLEDLPAEDDPRRGPPPRGQEQQDRLGVALELERAALRQRSGCSSRPVAEAERSGPLPVGGAEVADEARDDVVEAGLGERGQERPRIALAEEAARVRDPEALAAAGTRARRSRRSRSRSGSSRTGPCGSKPRTSSAIASETATIASACARDEPDDALRRLLLRLHRAFVERGGAAFAAIESRRSATQRDPGRALDRRADQVHRDAAG